MILVCSECKASYLVPASVFAHGPRTVRCARCAHTWLADLPSKIVVMPSEAEVQKPFADAAKPVKREQQPGAAATAENAGETPNGETHTIFSAANLPAIWRDPRWRMIKIGAAIAAGALAVVLLGWLALGGEGWSSLGKGINNMLKTAGLMSRQAGEGLNLQQIRSERRFESGGMQLVVEGEVQNSTSGTLQVPDIQAKALGPDRAVIQSWRIEAPVATLPAGASAPFHSSIVSPEDAVAEVNLSFAEPRNDR